MRLRRVTVHFGATRVVVPLKDHGMTVEELGHKAATRYERATGKPEGSINVHRMELVDGGGILDPEDLVADLLEVETDHILAICDEATVGEKPHANVVTIGEPSTSSGIVNSSSSSSMHRYDKLKSPVLGRVKGSVVEITSLENPPGLRVSNTSISNNAKSSNNSPHGGLSVQAQPLRSSLRTADNKDNPPRTVNRVTLSPEVEKKLSVEQERSSFTHLQRSSARKSRISDQFYDAIERLGLEERADQAGSRPLSGTIPLTSISTRKRPPLMPCPSDPESTVVVFPDDESSSMGIEVTGITDEDTGKLTSVQIIRLDDDGRVGMDGRLRVGDNIVQINGKHVSQLTILRVRALLHDLTTLSAPSLTVARPISSFSEFHRSEPSTSSSTSLPTKRPILSALQQANTQQLGDTQTVTVQKLSSGFGFTVTGRETARGERLFYVGTVKIGGAAVGLLKAGDRLLKVNGESLSGLQQSQVVDRLKAVKGGERIEIEISRVGQYTDDQQENTPPGETTSVKVERDDGKESAQKEQPENSVAKSPKSRPPPPPPAQKQEYQEKDSDSEKVESTSTPQLPYSKPPENTSGSHKAIMVQTHDGPPTEELDLLVPLNDTGSAGLGVSLKARVSVKSDGTRHDCGIFVKKVLVGGAAWKDGRLHVDDQLITIEGIDLRQFVRNAEASEAVTAKLKEIGPSAKVVRLRVARQIPSHSSHVSNSSRITVDGPDSSIMLGGGGSAMSTITTPLSRASRPSPGASSNRHSVDSSLLFALDHERRASSASVSTRKSDQGEEDLSPDPDAFDREAPARKSMSEKRGMGAAIDPSSMLTYQKIKHQRQTSAPSATVSRSFHGRSASQRAQARARSLSVHPRDPPRDSRRSDDVTSDSGHAPSEDSPQHRLSSAEGSPKRRSKSVDTKRDSSGSLVHEAVAVDSGRTGFSHPSFKHAIGDGETRLGSGAAEVGGGLMRSDAAQHRDSDKRNRRKSMGSQVKSWLGLGARSRDASPDRGFEEAKRREGSERMRIQESYDRLRAKEASKYGTPPMNLRRDRARVYSEYDPSYLQRPFISSFDGQTTPTDGFVIDNSRFYRSLGPRSAESTRMATAAVAAASRSRQPLTTSASSTAMSSTDGQDRGRPRAPTTPSRIPTTEEAEPDTPIHRPTTQSQVPSPTTLEWEPRGRAAEVRPPTFPAPPPQHTSSPGHTHLHRQDPHPHTTMPSTHGSPTQEEGRSARDQLSRPHSLGGTPLLLNPTPVVMRRGRSIVPTPELTLTGHAHSTMVTPTTSSRQSRHTQHRPGPQPSQPTSTLRSPLPTQSSRAGTTPTHLPPTSTLIPITTPSTTTTIGGPHQRLAPPTTITSTVGSSQARPRQPQQSHPHHIPIFPTSRVFFAPSGVKSSDRLSLRAKKKYRRGVRSACLEEEFRERDLRGISPGTSPSYYPIPVERVEDPRTRQLQSPSRQRGTSLLAPSVSAARTPSYRTAAQSSPPSAAPSQPTQHGHYHTPFSPHGPAQPSFSRQSTNYQSHPGLRLQTTTKESHPRNEACVDHLEPFTSVLSKWENRARSGAETLPARPRGSRLRPQLDSRMFDHPEARTTDC